MEIEGNEFFVLQGSEKIWVFENRNQGIEQMKSLMKEGADSENLVLMSVELNKDEIKAQVIPWSKIAEGLI